MSGLRPGAAPSPSGTRDAGAGRIWRFGDGIDTDAMAPGRYMKLGIDAIAQHCMEDLRPEFARDVRPGDVIVAGRNFGIGSSREQAPQALAALGIAAVVAQSFAGLFYRNAINLGLPVLVCKDIDALADGRRAAFDLDAATLELEDGTVVRLEPIPAFLRELINAGGLIPHLEKTLAADRGQVARPG